MADRGRNKAAAAAADEDRLRRERERIRIASQKTRQKKKQEETTLRLENEQMKRERLSLQSTLQELEDTLDRLQEQLEEKDEVRSEHEMLRRELEQYRQFGAACVLFGEQFQSKDDEDQVDLQKHILAQVARSGGEMSDLQAERVLAESLEDSRWTRMTCHSPIQQLSSCVSASYRLKENGDCEWQFSFAVPLVQNKAKSFADKYRSLWLDPRPLMSIFSSTGLWYGSIDEASVDHLYSEGSTHLLQIKNGIDKSWVFVLTGINADAIEVAKSTLIPQSDENVPFFALSKEAQEGRLAAAAGKVAAASSSSSAGVEITNRIGVVKCWRGTRASIMLDSSCESKMDCVKGKFLESFSVWNEDIESSDTRLAGPGVRGVCTMSASQEFATQTFGEVGFKTLIDFEKNEVAPPYQMFVNFLAYSLGMDKVPIDQIRL